MGSGGQGVPICLATFGAGPSARSSQRDRLTRRPHGNDTAPPVPGRKLQRGAAQPHRDLPPLERPNELAERRETLGHAEERLANLRELVDREREIARELRAELAAARRRWWHR